MPQKRRTSWQSFLKKHGGMGHSMHQLGVMYRRMHHTTKTRRGGGQSFGSLSGGMCHSMPSISSMAEGMGLSGGRRKAPRRIRRRK